MAEILETWTRPEAASTRRAPLEHAGTARLEARDVISGAALGFEPSQTRRGPDAPWRRSERRKARGRNETSPPADVRRKIRRSTDARGPRRCRTTPDGRHSALQTERNAVSRTPLRDERWRRQRRDARLVRSADCEANITRKNRFFGTAPFQAAKETCLSRARGSGTPSFGSSGGTQGRGVFWL